ncbi:MAG: SCO family protein [Saprospiraceae bacterium]|nr:SCO family protein [Saprospiraceae bacterium]
MQQKIITLLSLIRSTRIIFFLSIFILGIQCKQKTLPIIGIPSEVNGIKTYPKIPEFSYLNQDSQLVQLKDLKNKIHLACFFFTSCPTICPKVMRNMGRIAEENLNNQNIAYLCFSLDFKRDSISRLKDYYSKIGFTYSNFYLLRGNSPNDTKDLAQNYLSVASDDPEAPGGINHSGWILLIDKDNHIRSYADGTNDTEVDRLLSDLKILLSEMH